jgi:hypothetical protein
MSTALKELPDLLGREVRYIMPATADTPAHLVQGTVWAEKRSGGRVMLLCIGTTRDFWAPLDAVEIM